MSGDVLTQEYVPKYQAGGEQKFYRYLLLLAFNKLIMMEKGIYKGVTPELEYLEHYGRFMVLYRREGDEVYLQIAKLLRRTAHKVYRIMLIKNMTRENSKFLNVVK
jgi:hypothetical protein